MADYNKFCIVAEEQCVCVQKPRVHQEVECQKCGKYNFKSTTIKDVILRFCTWEFTIQCEGPDICSIDIKNTNKVPNNPMVAEIVVWQWDDQNDDNNHHQKVIKKFLYNNHNSLRLFSSILYADVHFTIRLLGKRKLVEDVCRPLDSSASDDALTISVGDKTFVVSAKRMMKVSPVFRRMLTVDMREKAERKVTIEDTDPEHFRAFLEVIDPDQNVYPNPTNVVGVLELARYYETDLARERCEAHLVNCVEMPLIERLQLAQTYGLKKLKDSILSIDPAKLGALYRANADMFKIELA